MTADLKEVFEHEMAGMVDNLEAGDGQGFGIKVDWVGFDDGASSWEPLASIWDFSPQFVKSELWKLRLDRGVRFTVLCSKVLVPISLSSSFGLLLGTNGASGML